MFFPELAERFARLFGLAEEEPATTLSPVAEPIRLAEGPCEDRALRTDEREIAEWLLRHADPPALDFLPQLEVARVTGRCSCGCPTIDLTLPEEAPRAEPRGSPFSDVTGYVGSNMVGLMLFQAGGHLTCLEVYDLSDIAHPYSLPPVSTLEVLRWPDVT